jgi:putative ABC transport system ATP-binding protein
MEKMVPAVKVVDVHKDYYLRGEVVHALRGINLEVPRGEYLSVMGPSGSGKTTLFNMVGGIDRPTRGRVYIDGVDIAKLDAYELAWLRCRKIGYIFQTFNLIPVLTAIENVMLPMIFAGVEREERFRRGREILEMVGLGDRLNHKPTELSGGQQQRVAIARALANNPVIILADEPTGNLDLHTGLEIITLLREMNKERGVTVISATHDLKMIDVSDRIIYLRDGRVDRYETRAEVYVRVSE